jgi:hypothetical protein
MTTKQFLCEWCAARMVPRVIEQRFCGRECSNAYHLAERHAAIAHFRSLGMRPRTQADLQRDNVERVA